MSGEFTQDFFTSRRNVDDGDTRIGDLDRLWYDSKTNTIRISDGITPGGIIVCGGSGFGGSGISGYSGFSGTGIKNWIKVTSNYTASNGDRIIADSTGGSYTLYLPAAPALGEYVQVIDGGDLATNPVTVDGNGSTIEGSLPTFPLNVSGAAYEFIYDGTTWQVTGTYNAVGVSGYSGQAGVSGYSGVAGQDGISGYSGEQGISGYSGLGLSGYSGEAGQSGYSGLGLSGYSGEQGISGYSGLGLSGYSGEIGASGYSGLGLSGYSGETGPQGFSGYSGPAGTGISPWIKETSYYLSSSGDRIIADTSGGSFIIDLPASPALGDYVVITDGASFAQNNLIVGRNGSTIEGYADDVALDMKGVTFEFIFNGATWDVTATTGRSGSSGYSGLSGALNPWQLKTSNYYAQNSDRIIGDTSAGSFTVFLPNPAVEGDYVVITDGDNFALNNLYVDPNGGTIEGLTDIVALDMKGVTYEFIWSVGTWDVTATTGRSGNSGWSGYSGVGGPGTSGYSGQQGASGYSGQQGASGYSGETGASGYSGETGASGYSGVGGPGASGYSGESGASGPPGAPGDSGYSGVQGISGYSGGSFAGNYIATISGGTGVTVTGGSGYSGDAVVSIGQPVGTADTVTFGNVVVGPAGTLTFYDDIAKAAAAGANFPYEQITAASRFYTNADALLGYNLSDMKPGDFYYDDVSASIYICIDTGLGYFDLLDLTVRA